MEQYLASILKVLSHPLTLALIAAVLAIPTGIYVARHGRRQERRERLAATSAAAEEECYEILVRGSGLLRDAAHAAAVRALAARALDGDDASRAQAREFIQDLGEIRPSLPMLGKILSREVPAESAEAALEKAQASRIGEIDACTQALEDALDKHATKVRPEFADKCRQYYSLRIAELTGQIEIRLDGFGESFEESSRIDKLANEIDAMVPAPRRRLGEARGGIRVVRRVRPRDPEAESMIKDAVERFASGRPDLAAKIFRDLVTKWPKDPAGWEGLCIMFPQEGRWEEALDAADRWAELAPGEAQAGVARAEALMMLGRLDEALLSVDRAIKKPHGRTARALMARSMILFRQGRAEAAVEAAGEAIDIDPNSPEAHCAWGEALSALRRFDDAIIALDRAIDLRAGDFEAPLLKAKTLNAAGRYSEAVPFLEGLKPNCGHIPELWETLAEAQRGLGLEKDAEWSTLKAGDVRILFGRNRLR